MKLGGLTARCLHVPGHTLGAVTDCFDGPSGRAAFTGDTMFCAGCGRLFEGTAAQMCASLAWRRRAPARRVCALSVQSECHEDVAAGATRGLEAKLGLPMVDAVVALYDLCEKIALGAPGGVEELSPCPPEVRVPGSNGGQLGDPRSVGTGKLAEGVDSQQV